MIKNLRLHILAGPNMLMHSGMKLSPSDWAKLTKARKYEVYKFIKIKIEQNKTLSNSTVQNMQLLQIVTSVIFFLISHFEKLHLYPLKSQLMEEHKLLFRILLDLLLLLDGGANGGLSGSDVVALCENLPHYRYHRYCRQHSAAGTLLYYCWPYQNSTRHYY